MASVTVVDSSGKAHDTLSLDERVFGGPVNGALLHQAVVRELAGARAGTHDTRGRSEVSGGGKKPWRQKGTGRARQGSIRATQWKGGGKPFGPTPRSYAQAMPRPARRAALRAALTDKLRGEQLLVVDAVRIAAPKTKALVSALAGLGVQPASTLLVLSGENTAVERAARNLPWLEVARPGHVSVAAVLRHGRLVVERDALLVLQEALAP